MAFKNVFRDPFTSSTKGSFTGNFRDPQSTECSRMWATPVEWVAVKGLHESMMCPNRVLNWMVSCGVRI